MTRRWEKPYKVLSEQWQLPTCIYRPADRYEEGRCTHVSGDFQLIRCEQHLHATQIKNQIQVACSYTCQDGRLFFFFSNRLIDNMLMQNFPACMMCLVSAITHIRVSLLQNTTCFKGILALEQHRPIRSRHMACDVAFGGRIFLQGKNVQSHDTTITPLPLL